MSYILGAPDLVTQPFRDLFADGVPLMTPLVAGSGGQPGAIAESGGRRRNEDFYAYWGSSLSGEPTGDDSLGLGRCRVPDRRPAHRLD